MSALASLLVAGALHAEHVALPGQTVLRIDIDQSAAEKPWAQFLDKLLDHFDRNRDGSLDAHEVKRIFPLPVPGGTLTWDFAALDADKSGTVTSSEVRSFAKSRGFAPIAFLVDRRPSPEDRRLGRLFETMAVDDLNRFDLNDDERLDRRELLASAPEAEKRENLLPSKKTDAANAILRIVPGDGPGTPNRFHLDAKDVIFETAAPKLRTNAWIAALDPIRGGFDTKAVRTFLIAQFDTARGDTEFLTQAEVDDDATLLGLQSLFPFADRDGDKQLSAGELTNFLALIDQAVRAQVWVTVADRDRNLFDAFDADRDGFLDVREQRPIRAILAEKTRPFCVRISLAPPSPMVWGGVLVPLATPPKQPAPASDALPWFAAMDRNADGWISRREFLGPPSLFQSLDADRDDLISPAEAKKSFR